MELLPNIHQLIFPLIPEVWGSLYLLTGDRLAIVDTGVESTISDVLVPYLRELSLSLEDVESIVISHPHYDHAGGAHDLQDRIPDAERMGHPYTLDVMVDPLAVCRNQRAQYPYDHPYVSASTEEMEAAVGKPAAIQRCLADGEVIHLGDRDWRVVYTPGHNPGLLSLLDEEHGVMLVTDSCQGDGTVDGIPIYEDLVAYYQTLDRIEGLAPDVLVVSHPFQPQCTSMYKKAEVVRFLEECRQISQGYSEWMLHHMRALPLNYTLGEITDDLRQTADCSGERFYTVMSVRAHLEWLTAQGEIECYNTPTGMRWKAV